jgi:hypothetical protein
MSILAGLLSTGCFREDFLLVQGRIDFKNYHTEGTEYTQRKNRCKSRLFYGLYVLFCVLCVSTTH